MRRLDRSFDPPGRGRARRQIACAAAVLGTVLSGGCGDHGPDPALLDDPSAYAEAVVVATNAARAADGLPELASSSCAQGAALVRAQDRVEAGDLVHDPLDDVFEACSDFSVAAENLVDSAASPQEVVDAWMDSPGHRANILDADLTEVGVGCVTSDQGLLCSQVFLGQQ